MFAVIRLGKSAFPCGVSVHETRWGAHQAVKIHALRHGLTLVSTAWQATGTIQITTEPGRESMNSYVIMETGDEDDNTNDHGFDKVSPRAA
jgi:hypothetical protein